VGADIGGSPAVPGGGSTPAIPATPNNRCSAFSGFTVSFTVSGGQPPYTFSTAGAYPGARISANGVYTAPTLPGPFGVGQSITDTVTVKDSLGVTAPATITVSCVSAPAA
jgi:hypothetical protein